MGVKSLALLGIVISSLFVYLCIDSKKDMLYAKIDKKATVKHIIKQDINTTQKKEAVIPQAKKELKEPSFAYISGPSKGKIAGIFSTKDKDTQDIKNINSICLDKNCTNEIKYFDNIKHFTLSQDVLSLINSSSKMDIEGFNFTLENKSLTIAGLAKDQESIDKILKNCEPFVKNGYKLSNGLSVKTKDIKKTISKPVLTKTVVKKEVIENKAKADVAPKIKKVDLPKKVDLSKVKKKKIIKIEKKVKKKKIIKIEKKVKPKKVEIKKVVIKKVAKKIVKVEKKRKKSQKVIKDVKVKDLFVVNSEVDPLEAGYRISDILGVEPISFDETHHISSDSKATLNKIAQIIKELHGVKVVVTAHTNRQESTTYANVLTQKRAYAIRNYLISQGVRGNMIRTVSKGDSEPISDPDDDINNRIEIEIKER